VRERRSQNGASRSARGTNRHISTVVAGASCAPSLAPMKPEDQLTTNSMLSPTVASRRFVTIPICLPTRPEYTDRYTQTMPAAEKTIMWTPKARAVLAAANELFYAHGIQAIGVDAIAERAGVTKKTLYDRF